jgi:hypothetical protein
MGKRAALHAQEAMAEPRKDIEGRFAEAQNWLREVDRLANHILNGGSDPAHDLASSMGALSAHLRHLQMARRRLN